MALPNTGKLVRDKIPQIIRDSGRQPHVTTIDHGDMRAALELKLAEEIEELLIGPEESRLEEEATAGRTEGTSRRRSKSGTGRGQG